MSILTNDDRFEKVQNSERKVTNMCEILDKVEARGFETAEHKWSSLISILCNHNNYDLIKEVATNKEKREELYKKYNIN